MDDRYLFLDALRSADGNRMLRNDLFTNCPLTPHLINHFIEDARNRKQIELNGDYYQLTDFGHDYLIRKDIEQEKEEELRQSSILVNRESVKAFQFQRRFTIINVVLAVLNILLFILYRSC